ncbi:hypothetical protein ACHAQA_006162 [Verticillium albo-atrum]
MASQSDAPKDLRPISRFITTHAKDGTTSFSQAVAANVPFRTIPSGSQFALCYATDQFPVNMTDDEDLATYKRYTENLPGITISGGTVLRVVDFPPGDVSPMHRTVSLDYGVVLEGEIEMVLDSGESRVLGPGDMMIQRGTNHEWRNTSMQRWARMLYVLLPAKDMVVGGQPLTDNTHETVAQ